MPRWGGSAPPSLRRVCRSLSAISHPSTSGDPIEAFSWLITIASSRLLVGTRQTHGLDGAPLTGSSTLGARLDPLEQALPERGLGVDTSRIYP
jgi:hypothetical protein